MGMFQVIVWGVGRVMNVGSSRVRGRFSSGAGPGVRWRWVSATRIRVKVIPGARAGTVLMEGSSDNSNVHI